MISNFEGCQLPCIPKVSDGPAKSMDRSVVRQVKRMLAVPWNYHAKKWLRRLYHSFRCRQGGSPAQAAKDFVPRVPLKSGDLVRVRSAEEIMSTLDPFKELKGCAFLPDMYKYCGTDQRVLKSMQFFLDERDYRLKKVHGLILLEDVICSGTPTFGACDRCCFLFWREEWLEKINEG